MRDADLPAFRAVHDWLIAGHSKSNILESIEENFPECNIHSVVLNAMVALSGAVREPSDFVLGWCLESTRAIYQKMLNAGDYAGALSAIKEVARLNASHNQHLDPEKYLRMHQ